MIPKIIHYVWVGDHPKPPLVLKCIESWRRFCSDWEFREWGNDFVATVDNRYVREAFAHRKWAFVSDWIRLYALNEFGGVYLDTDMELQKPLDRFLNDRFFIEWEYISGKVAISCGVIACEPRNPVVKRFLKEYDQLAFRRIDGELDQTPNTVRIVDYFKNHWHVTLGDPESTVCFDDGCYIYPNSWFFSKEGFTFHHYAASWLDVWFRKLWLKIGSYKIVRFKRRKEVASGPIQLIDGEKVLCSMPLGDRKRIALLKMKKAPR